MERARNNLSILITGAGSPSIVGTIESIRQVYPAATLIGVDIDPTAVGQYFVDKFFQISNPQKPNFIEELVNIVKANDVRIIIPQVTKELFVLAEHIQTFNDCSTRVLVNETDSLSILNNKYRLLQACEKAGLTVAKYDVVTSNDALIKSARDFGYPDNRIVVKLPVSNGMRGLRILANDIKKSDIFYDKPHNIICSLEEFLTYFTEKDFPELLIMEYLPGEEVSVDCLAQDGKMIAALPRIRDKIRMGVTFSGRTIKDQNIIDQCQQIISHLRLSHMIGFQFKYDAQGRPMLLESNPRVQGTMAQATYSGVNVIAGAIELALNGRTSVKQSAIEWGLEFVRYWGGMAILEDKLIGKF